MAEAIPLLETDRLILRGHCASDFGDCVDMWSDPNIVRHTIGTVSPASRTWSRMLAYVGHWSMLGYGYWAVEEKTSRRYVGELGFADFKRGLPAPVGILPEMGWALLSRVHGRGYATEAMRAALTWGDAHLVSNRTSCLIVPANVASIRLAEKFGFQKRDAPIGVQDLYFERDRDKLS